MRFNARTRLDAAETQSGFLDVKMRTEIVTQPRDLVAVLGSAAQLSCQVRSYSYTSYNCNRISKPSLIDSSLIESVGGNSIVSFLYEE